MSATARDFNRASMNETIDYGSGSEGSPVMANASPQAAFRYTYGSGARPLDGYTIKRAIGRGGFGEVYYATSDSGKEVALKLITRNVEIERRGVAQCMNLKCPNLLTIYDVRSNDAGETFVVMEYIAGPSLAGVLEKHPNGMPVNEVRAWLKGLVEGVDYLHDHGIVHRDLKPANLFLEEGVVKIGDYGLCKIISTQQGSEHSESIGTCHYMAPEISTGKYHKPIDIYAIGVILFEMITGRVPFEGETVGEVLMKHLTTRPDLTRLAEPYRTIIGEALAKDPVNRPKRAHDLLGADDSPKPRDVRFIGEGKTAPAAEADPRGARGRGWWGRDNVSIKDQDKPRHRPEEDDILRIGEVDPVFYIGPETRTARPAAPSPRRRAPVPAIRWAGEVIRKTPERRPVPQLPTAPVRPARAAAPVPAPKPPPEPVPMPSQRVRLGELTASMVKAAIAVAALCGMALYANPQGIPSETVAFFFGSTLIGVWGMLLASKPLEGSKAGKTVRSLVNVTMGIGVGLAVGVLGSWLHVANRTGPLRVDLPLPPEFNALLGNQMLAFLIYFGLGFLVNGWFRLADRDRSGHVRFIPLIVSTLLMAFVSPLWPTRDLWVVWLLPAVTLVTQAVSPWNKQAAKYRFYIGKNKVA